MASSRTGLIRITQLDELFHHYAKFGTGVCLQPGMYVLAIGELASGQPGDEPSLVASKVTDITRGPDRLAMWMCEVIDAQLQLARAGAPPLSALPQDGQRERPWPKN